MELELENKLILDTLFKRLILNYTPEKSFHRTNFLCSSHPLITWEIIQTYPELPWCWSGISKNENITWDIIQTYSEKKWDWYWVSQNPNITWDIIKAHPEKPWDFYHVLFNKHITWDIIKAHPEKFEITNPSHSQSHHPYWMNPNSILPTSEERVTFYRRVLAARRIWRAWFRAWTNPAFALCRVRLAKEYKEMKVC